MQRDSGDARVSPLADGTIRAIVEEQSRVQWAEKEGRERREGGRRGQHEGNRTFLPS
jgi:hypothetical protein